MNTLSIRIESPKDLRAAVSSAISRGQGETHAGLSFASYDLMHRVLAPKRLAIVRAMAGQGAMSIREVARRVGRDFKGVHTDIGALVAAGVVDRTEGGIVFPYDAIHVEFEIATAA